MSRIIRLTMPYEHALWRIDSGTRKLDVVPMQREAVLEELIAADLRILNDRWLLIGRQEATEHGGIIDLLAVDQSGALIIIELKKNLTPREVVAQALDYASWVEGLASDAIASIFDAYIRRYRPDLQQKTLNQVFRDRFGVDLADEELNQSHQIVVVASRLDPSTERIVRYLSGRGVEINVLFFQVFGDADHRLLSRVWFIDPIEVELQNLKPLVGSVGDWNGECYVSFGMGDERSWDDAVRYGFISAGGGRWYTSTLSLLSPGDRVWVNIPGAGYVGVGEVTAPAVKVDQFFFSEQDGSQRRLLDAPLAAKNMGHDVEDAELAEYVVAVRWLRTVPYEKRVREVGFFGNQHSVCKPKTSKWTHTVDRLRSIFAITDANG